ncbi:ketoacyl-ACP synthase III [Treponema zuelzerae]|uniref:Beta-ketoacyl-[acyl-carrier-protein] synthase III n=1 Tax=Teretinema zuelzerae TaxID=156 RepID=A0AAE3EHJ7_9SPIR|nr:beta-ketoacyl-ACP synthase III [Teretinema zuelzerae]MCD1655115.1 ketoacyl-ACP synthase III [Teretinema zuelzerae]
MAVEIISTGSYLPARRVTNDELSKTVETNDEWIRSHTGIGSRHIASEEEATSDLAVKAALAAFETLAPGNPESVAETIDLVIVGTSSPDYYGFPSVACIVQDKLGIKKAGAFDLVAACSGFAYSLEAAAGMLSLGNRKRALVIGADTLTRITDWEDRGTCVLFGDGAGAAILERTDAPAEGPQKRGLIHTVLGSEGNGALELYCEKGGSRNPYKDGETIEKKTHIYMNGRAVYTFAVRAFTDTMERLLEETGLTMADIKKIVPHQANMRIIQAAAKRLGIPEDKFFMNIEKYANTSNATIPIALDEYARTGELHKGDIIMTVGFGGGLTYAGNIIVW